MSRAKCIKAKEQLKNCLQFVYNKINRLSSVMWGLGSLVKNRLRSADVEESDKWKKETNAQVGYGEITKGCMTRTFNIMQRITDFIPPAKHRMLIGPVEEYNMSEKSRFLDIGSGFGKPVFHAAIQVGCEAKGIEVVPIRAEFTNNFLKTLVSNTNKWEDDTIEDIKLSGKKRYIKQTTQTTKKLKLNTLELRSRTIQFYNYKQNVENSTSKNKKAIRPMSASRREDKRIKKKEKKTEQGWNKDWNKNITFIEVDASKFESYKNSKGRDYTHIYSYNKVMTKETIKDLCRILNNTEYKVLAWYFNEKETRKCGLKNFMLVNKMPMLTTGGQKFVMYIYVKLKRSFY